MRSKPSAKARSSTARREKSRSANRARVVSADHPFLVTGRQVLGIEAKAIESLAPRLGPGFVHAVELMLACQGRVVVTGMGKPGFIAQKFSATLSSTGTPSFYLHPAEAVHGDLGRVTKQDVVLALSNSGTTEELLRILPPLKKIGPRLVAITGEPESPLAKAADVVIEIGRIDEACPMGLVPTASSAALHAVCDALAMTVLENRDFSSEEYALYHPGGQLGRRMMRVSELMRSGPANPVVREDAPISQAVAVMTNTTGRPGATNVVDRKGKLVGIFTDGDLRRLLELGRRDFDAPVQSVMGKKPSTCLATDLVHEAAAAMRAAKVDQLPVVDAQGRAIGLLDVQDLLAARFL